VSKGPKSGKLKTRKGRASSKPREGLVQGKNKKLKTENQKQKQKIPALWAKGPKVRVVPLQNPVRDLSKGK
jgi:hypothetical protein